MPRTEPATLVVVIEGFDLPRRRSLQTGAQAPGRDNVHLALRGTCKDRAAVVTPGHPWQATEPIPGDAASVRWQVEVTVRRGEHGLDFGGPFVRGDRADRHLGIVWGDIRADGTFQLICGSKLRLADVDPGLVEGAMRSGGRLLARVRLTDAHGIHLRAPQAAGHQLVRRGCPAVTQSCPPWRYAHLRTVHKIDIWRVCAEIIVGGVTSGGQWISGSECLGSGASAG